MKNDASLKIADKKSLENYVTLSYCPLWRNRCNQSNTIKDQPRCCLYLHRH